MRIATSQSATGFASLENNTTTRMSTGATIPPEQGETGSQQQKQQIYVWGLEDWLLPDIFYGILKHRVIVRHKKITLFLRVRLCVCVRVCTFPLIKYTIIFPPNRAPLITDNSISGNYWQIQRDPEQLFFWTLSGWRKILLIYVRADPCRGLSVRTSITFVKSKRVCVCVCVCVWLSGQWDPEESGSE